MSERIGGPVLFIGEALLDLICERPLGAGELPDRLVPHFGGTVANVALMCARAGAPTALAGGVGDDGWGAWLIEQLRIAGVALEHFHAAPGVRTPAVMTRLDAAGEPSYSIYSPQPDLTALALQSGAGGQVDVELMTAGAGALFISSNSLVGEGSRAISLAAREAMLASRRPVIFDPNLRLHRWDTTDQAVDVALACVPGTLLVRCNAAEARLLTGEVELHLAASALLALGARNVVISDGAAGAIARGAVDRDCEGVPARVISTVGGGDAQMAALLAALVLGGYDEASIVDALPGALQAAARACERWGACD